MSALQNTQLDDHLPDTQLSSAESTSGEERYLYEVLIEHNNRIYVENTILEFHILFNNFGTITNHFGQETKH